MEVKEEEINENWEGIELSDVSIEFLLKLFDTYSSLDGNLDHDGLEQIFLTTIDGCPWEIENETHILRDGKIDKTTWIGLWTKAFFLDYEKAFELLVYLGYIGSFHEAVIIHKNRKNSLLHGHDKNVFNCYVVGDEKVGKTHLLEMIIKEHVEDEMLELEDSRSIVTTFRMNNKDKYLILTEFNAATIEDALLSNRRMMNYCDVF